ncbi:MAG: glutaredoxin family protein [Desulfobacterales bacterium]|nr:glutaredoxin family protein [Desulfobacterales bacterium]
MPANNIMIYSLSTCTNCKLSMELLDKQNVKYEFLDVDLLEKEERKPHLKKIKELNPKCSFPTIKIGESVVVGFREEQIKEALERL